MSKFSLIIEALGDALERQELSILKQKYEIEDLRRTISELEQKLKRKEMEE